MLHLEKCIFLTDSSIPIKIMASQTKALVSPKHILWNFRVFPFITRYIGFRVTFTFQLPKLLIFRTLVGADKFWPRLLLKDTNKPLFYRKTLSCLHLKIGSFFDNIFARGQNNTAPSNNRDLRHLT